jgi:hypothetical protein
MGYVAKQQQQHWGCSMKPIIFDDSRFPLVVVTFPAEYTADQVAGMLARTVALLRMRQPFVLITDMRQVGIPSAEHDALVRKMIDQNRDALRRYCLGSVNIIANPILRTMARAMALAIKTPFPVASMASVEESMAWAESKLPKAAAQGGR